MLIAADPTKPVLPQGYATTCDGTKGRTFGSCPASMQAAVAPTFDPGGWGYSLPAASVAPPSPDPLDPAPGSAEDDPEDA